MQGACIVRVHFLTRVKQWIISVFNPPYQLALCDRLPGKHAKECLYLFKLYGSHDFVKLSHADILASNQIMSAINPRDLIKIALLENNLKAHDQRCRVEEEMRGNHYRIHLQGNSEVYSGESICQNIDYFAELNAQEICRIAYSAGFQKGRALSRQISRAGEEARRQDQAAPENAAKVVALRRGAR
ncbi:hypothetical protein [Chromobacterium alticapitis]|nr:hypothetical protein [Chromobacterium alticapitis]